MSKVGDDSRKLNLTKNLTTRDLVSRLPRNSVIPTLPLKPTQVQKNIPKTDDQRDHMSRINKRDRQESTHTLPHNTLENSFAMAGGAVKRRYRQ
jgi:hypothetical protein